MRFFAWLIACNIQIGGIIGSKHNSELATLAFYFSPNSQERYDAHGSGTARQYPHLLGHQCPVDERLRRAGDHLFPGRGAQLRPPFLAHQDVQREAGNVRLGDHFAWLERRDCWCGLAAAFQRPADAGRRVRAGRRAVKALAVSKKLRASYVNTIRGPLSFNRTKLCFLVF